MSQRMDDMDRMMEPMRQRIVRQEELLREIAAMTIDGEEVDGEAYIQKSDDAVETLGRIIEEARQLA